MLNNELRTYPSWENDEFLLHLDDLADRSLFSIIRLSNILSEVIALTSANARNFCWLSYVIALKAISRIYANRNNRPDTCICRLLHHLHQSELSSADIYLFWFFFNLRGKHFYIDSTDETEKVSS